MLSALVGLAGVDILLEEYVLDAILWTLALCGVLLGRWLRWPSLLAIAVGGLAAAFGSMIPSLIHPAENLLGLDIGSRMIVRLIVGLSASAVVWLTLRLSGNWRTS